METTELKFLLKLLSFPDYRAPLAKVAPNSRMPAAERERMCRKLCDRELVDCSYEITKFKIELRAIEEAWRYSDEEFFAGIPQRVGSRLFFIRLK